MIKAKLSSFVKRMLLNDILNPLASAASDKGGVLKNDKANFMSVVDVDAIGFCDLVRVVPWTK